ncbi:MAG: radical SAM protein [Deltaproteobacteria bacterium]|jgi:uncharacterized protein|nr:radical SAM protein [Deltaproteobacteria bacterium]
MPINFLILILTTRCDLQCAYCYNGDRPSRDMSLSVLRQALTWAANGQEPLRIQLTGGEPTLVPDLIALTLQEAQKLKRPYKISLQTNAKNINRELARFFWKNKIEVGVSLDGAPDINDAQRGATRAVLAGLEALASENCPFGATTVVTGLNQRDLSRIPLILAQYGSALGFGLDLLIHKGRLKIPPPEAENLRLGLIKLAQTLDFINARRKKPLVWRERRTLRSHLEKPGQVFCQACQRKSLAVGPEGSLYPCGQTAFDERFRLGDVFAPTLAPSPLGTINLRGPQCQDCLLKQSCPGDCPSRISYNQNHNPDLACLMWRVLAQNVL